MFHVAEIFSDSGYSIFISLYFFLLIIIMFNVFILLWLTSYYVIHGYCVLCIVYGSLGRWRGCVYNVGRPSPLCVCACVMGKKTTLAWG